ncbi:MAG: molybdate ABC transporter substrate-binding protein [Beijerinckiaceae bacterium]
MNWMRRRGAIAVLIANVIGFVLGFVLACEPAGAQAPKADQKGPVIFAAASMKTALDAIAAAWTQQTRKPPAISYASSAVLAKQIEQGAPADVFISADLEWMDYLDKAKSLKAGTRRNLLGNQLVLIEPADAETSLKIQTGFDLAGAAGDGKIAVCTIAACPGGIYAKQALEKLGVWAAVEPKLAQADNIRSATALVARGEAKFGIVYATDAKAESKVRVVDVFPAATHAPIIYPVAVIATSKNPDAEAFVAFMTSQAATKALVEQGFAILSK